MNLKPTLAVVLFPGLLSALSCTCDPPPETPLCQFPKKIAITFVGKAIETNPAPANGDEVYWEQRWFRFQIEEPFKGLQKNEKYLVVYEGFGNGRIQIGENYFVHAFLEQGIVKFVNCGITGPVSQRTSEIENMRAWAGTASSPISPGLFFFITKRANWLSTISPVLGRVVSPEVCQECRFRFQAPLVISKRKPTRVATTDLQTSRPVATRFEPHLLVMN